MNTPLKDLTIKNNFMFAAVMSDEENCKGVSVHDSIKRLGK